MTGEYTIPFGWDDAQQVFRESLPASTWGELFLQVQQLTSLRLEDGIIRTVSQVRDAGTGVRIVAGANAGFAYCERFDRAGILAAASHAKWMFKNAVDGSIPLPQNQALNGSKQGMRIVDELPGVPMELRAEILHRLNEAARSASDKVTNVTATLMDSAEWVAMFHSDGLTAVDHRPMITLSVQVQVESAGTVRFGRAGFGFRDGFDRFRQLKPEDLATESVRKALLQLEAVEAPAGVMPVVLGPGDPAVLIHESVGHPLEADFVRKRSSAYTDRLGDLVANERCTIIDDGTVPGNRGEVSIDDELVPGERTTLIEAGRLAGFMHDRISAAELDMRLTGNGRRESFRYAPMPRMTTTVLAAGAEEPAEMIEATRSGIYCSGFSGGQVNIASGDFVFVPDEAYRIENGKITVPVRNLTLIGNGPDILSRVDHVGNDFAYSSGTWTCGKGQTVPVGIGMPSVRISEMTVGGGAHEG